MKKDSSLKFYDELDPHVLSVVRSFYEAKDDPDKSYEDLVNVIRDLLDNHVAVAFACLSKVGASRLSEEEWDHHIITNLKKAADLGWIPSVHDLGVCYDAGDFGLNMDTLKAAQLFKDAARKGHAHSQWIYGMDLLHGSNGVKQDVALGVKYIKESAASKFEGALESMAEFFEKGSFGFPVDIDEAKKYRNQIASGDFLVY